MVTETREAKLGTQLYAPAPFTEARVCLVEGDQGGGKSTFGVARIRDAYDNDCARIFCENVLKIKCEIKHYDRRHRVVKIRYNGGLRLLRIPQNYKLYSPMGEHIFANIHLYGIPYRFCPSFEHLMLWLKQGKMVDGWLLVDEAYLGMNARACMTVLGKELESQYFQFRKMRLNIIIVSPMARLIDWTMRTIPTEHVRCEYNEKTCKVTATIRKRGKRGERKVDFEGIQYWPNFRTNERIVR